MQDAADPAASKHLGDSRNLGKAGPRADQTRRRTVDDTAMPEFGEYEVRCFARVETRFHVRASMLRPARLRDRLCLQAVASTADLRVGRTAPLASQATAGQAATCAGWRCRELVFRARVVATCRALRIPPTRFECDVRQTRALVTETRRAASAVSRGPRGPVRRWTRARPADVIDLFVYVVVLNLAIEYTPSVISESFTLSLLTAALLKIALELVILLKTQLITRLRAADTRRAKLAAAGSLWVVAAASKLVVLELVDLVFAMP